MSQSKRIQQNFSRAAAMYDVHAHFQQQQAARVHAAAIKFLPEKAYIFDIGCGTGQLGLLSQSKRPHWRITGVDFSHAMAKQAQPRCHRVAVAEATALPFGDGVADGVISSLCIQWVEDKARMLAEMRRVLKPGGTAVVCALADGTLKELRAASKATGIAINLHPLLPASDYRQLAADSHMQILGFQQSMEHHPYVSVQALMRSIRDIGASSASVAPHPVAPRKFLRMVDAYSTEHSSSIGIYASWQPVLMVLRKS